MEQIKNSRFALVAVLAGALLLVPAAADAQGRSNGKREKDRPELIRRDTDRDRRTDRRDDDRRYEDRRYEDRRYEDRRGDDRRGPAFCRNGQGHPVHGMCWCRDKGFGNDRWDGRDRRDDDRRYDDRRYDEYGRNGSYDRAHQEFHYRHDRQCRMRAAERPLDVQWQLRVRADCRERHEEWHYRAGRRHT